MQVDFLLDQGSESALAVTSPIDMINQPVEAAGRREQALPGTPARE